ncbi:GNAT family N-acetyltransferase [Chitinophaga ginsengisegetis]|uniref:GNAT family N-acetyltransferase n=2 Tax=Chitinophaga ginsengisegetis TaxID=393003 RepID=UPI000DC02495|nr:GNAT family N-acetyltransferase [Chitinophaga ginsengisegetis]MDR6565681.1 ElaA protein [Chitinophaga ginsengisegetis]MDR6645410.1 ElaA protein [Chitinophaga ginsengisegetis]MDR6651998.1 ElaA protein [Chitinophaga ginsengisegetis]
MAKFEGMIWNIKSFEELTTAELYAILHLRSEVFVVEQNCAYQDLDYSDQKGLHLMGTDEEGRLLAYTRIFPPGIKFKEASIGRVITSPLARGKGAGRELMERSIAALQEHYGVIPIRIGAQQYLQRFYTSLGFEQTSDTYMEDGIPHIEMLRP